MSELRGLVHRGDIVMFYAKLAEARSLIAQAEAALSGESAQVAGMTLPSPISASTALHMAVGCLNAAASVSDWAMKNSMAGTQRVNYEEPMP